jgi:TorA maturation chaperone TorD
MTEAPATHDAAATIGIASPEPEDQLRADTYRVLGRLLAAPPDAETLDLFAAAPVSNEDSLLAVAWRMLAMSAERATPGDVADEYQTLFIGLGRGELVPFGSWYLTGFLMEQPLARLRTDMQKLGFERQDDVSEPEDHAAALCEIMALLAEDAGPGSLEVQAAFFETHIGTWMARFFRDMQEASSARFYRAVGQLGEQFINTDQRYLEMVERSDATPGEPVRPGIS